jgi:hypothetical protein
MIQRFPYLARVIVSCRYLVELHRVNQEGAPGISRSAGLLSAQERLAIDGIEKRDPAGRSLTPVFGERLLATDRCPIGLLWVAIGRTEQVGV